MATTTAYLRVSTDKQTLENQRNEILRFANRKVILYSVKENFCLSNNINSKVILFAFGLAAEIERDLIVVRTKEALAMRKEHGMPLGRKPGDSPKMLVLKAMKSELLRQRASGVTICQLSTIYGVSRGTMGRFLSDNKK